MIKLATVTETTRARVDWNAVAPDVLDALQGLGKCVYKSGREAGLERSLLHLVYLRASQINGCAWCIDMHTKDARAEGETEQRLYLVSAWREAPFFTPRERAALAWTEAVTLVSVDHVPDEVFDYARQHFTEKELVYLTLAIIAINGWNRLNVSMRTPVGDYRPS